MTTLHLGTRKSALALWQATYVRDRLLALHPGLNVTLVPMTTAGDRQLTGSFKKNVFPYARME